MSFLLQCALSLPLSLSLSQSKSKSKSKSKSERERERERARQREREQEGTNCYYFEAKMLQTLIGEDHYKKISRHFQLRLSNEAPVELPFELDLQEFDR